MTPEVSINLTELAIEVQPSYTYKLDLTSKRIHGTVDNEEALLQTVMKILYTERYGYVIYSSQYGVELEQLVGQEYEYVIADIERIITEALVVDDRILGINDFEAEKSGSNSLTVSFAVNSIYGVIQLSTEVQIV